MPESALLHSRISFLAGVPLFAGIPEGELEELAHVMGTVELSLGDVLFRQGEEADGLHVLERGLVQASRRLPGEDEFEYARLGAGEVLGEIPLLDGGLRTGTVRALEPTSALFLARADFTALVSRLHPTAFAIKRQIVRLACERLRASHGRLVATLGGGSAEDAIQPEALQEAAPEDLPHGQLPDPEYVRRLPFFRAYGEPEYAELLNTCRLAAVPPRSLILHEGLPANACCIALNGAIEEVIRRGGQAVRVRLCGPGRAFGYVGLIDGLPSSVSVATRERALLLVVPCGRFETLFHGGTISSYSFFNAIEHDLMAALRQAQSPQARLAAAAG
jgi:CRP/FNR family transcriptional regulator, cyclic AMP receptor protein